MATRATYQFKTANAPTVTLYCHWDGYPSGAAYRFARMAMHGTGGPVESFVRANLDAEVTESHQAHGDTEYRYTLHDGMIRVESCGSFGWSGSAQPLANWLNDSLTQSKWPDDEPELRTRYVMQGRRCMPVAHVVGQVVDGVNAAADSYAKGCTGNAFGYLSDASTKSQALIPADLPDGFAETVRDTLALALADVPHMADHAGLPHLRWLAEERLGGAAHV